MSFTLQEAGRGGTSLGAHPHFTTPARKVGILSSRPLRPSRPRKHPELGLGLNSVISVCPAVWDEWHTGWPPLVSALMGLTEEVGEGGQLTRSLTGLDLISGAKAGHRSVSTRKASSCLNIVEHTWDLGRRAIIHFPGAASSQNRPNQVKYGTEVQAI